MSNWLNADLSKYEVWFDLIHAFYQILVSFILTGKKSRENGIFSYSAASFLQAGRYYIALFILQSLVSTV